MHFYQKGSFGQLYLHYLKLVEWFDGAESHVRTAIFLAWHQEQLLVSGAEHFSYEFRKLLGSLWEAAAVRSSMEVLWVWYEKEEKGGWHLQWL